MYHVLKLFATKVFGNIGYISTAGITTSTSVIDLNAMQHLSTMKEVR
jgi:hypothetical protein